MKLTGLAFSGAMALLAAQAPTFSLIVHVHDETLRSPGGLGADDFVVRIDGKPSPIRSVRPAGPFSVLLLLDTSASMSGVVGPSELVGAVTAVAAQLRPAETLRVAAFNTDVEMGPDAGASPATVSDFLRKLSYRGATRLYDAVDTGLTVVERQPGRRVVVVLSDGSDTDSRRTGDEVLTRARRSDVQVWALLPSDTLRRVKGRGPDKALMRIVEDTGGVSVQRKDADLASALSDVVRYLREDYALDVDAAAGDRNAHKVDVRVKRAGLTLRAPRSAALAVACGSCETPARNASATPTAPLEAPGRPVSPRPAVPAVAPPSFRDPVTGAMVSGPGVVGPRAVYSPTPTYPQSALKDRITGQVFMEAVVDEAGRVQSVRVTRSLRQDLDDSAVETLKTWRFEPARRDGQAMAAQLTITMSFNVR
jgi:Ca-activated chloride channel family protein